MNKIVIIDTETTGLPKSMEAPYTDLENWPRIVSIAWLVFTINGRLLNKEHFFIMPETGVVSTPEAIAVHGITHEFASENGVDLERVLAMLRYDCFSYSWQKPVLVAHNVGFDRPVLLAELLRFDLAAEIEDCKWVCTKEAGAKACKIEPTKAYSERFPNAEYMWPSLDELHQSLFEGPVPGREKFHGALQDAEACAKCFWEMKKVGGPLWKT